MEVPEIALLGNLNPATDRRVDSVEGEVELKDAAFRVLFPGLGFAIGHGCNGRSSYPDRKRLYHERLFTRR